MSVVGNSHKARFIISICVALLIAYAPVGTSVAQAKPAWKDNTGHPGKGRKKKSSDSEPVITEEPVGIEEPVVTTPEPVNSAPVISGTPATSAMVGEFYEFVPVASDPDGDQLQFSIVSPPDWADFDPLSGSLYGTPDGASVGTFSGIQIVADDGQDTTALESFSILVEPAPLVSVTVNWEPPLQNEDGSQIEDLSGYRIYSVASDGSLSQLAELTNVGVTSHFLDGLTPGVWSLAMTATNAAGLESDLSNTVLFDLR